MNYREAVAVIRTQRNRDELVVMRAAWAKSAELRSEARRQIAQLKAERDAEIRRLRREGVSMSAIAAEVGCSRGLVDEILHPWRRAVYNRRRREHCRKISHLSAVPENASNDAAAATGDGARNPVVAA